VTATGTVSYTFFTNGTCTGTGTSAGTETLSSGSVPKSNTESELADGSYSFQASYSGDSNYGGSSSTCETFSVGLGTSSISTNVDDATTNHIWSGSETTGASAYDTSTVTTSDGVTEATDTLGGLYGDARLLSLLEGCAGLTLDEVVARILESIREFVGTAPQSDDITISLVRFGPNE